jgi:hypothetical protein
MPNDGSLTSLSLSLSLMLWPTVSRQDCLGIKHPFRLTARFLLFWQLRVCCCGALSLSDERTGLSFTIAVGSRQCNYFRVLVPWDSRLRFSPPPTTRRATVEAFDPASTLCTLVNWAEHSFCNFEWTEYRPQPRKFRLFVVTDTCFSKPLSSNGLFGFQVSDHTTVLNGINARALASGT